MVIKRIKFLINKLEELGFQPDCNRTSEFYDEPKFYCYNTRLKLSRKYTDGFISKIELDKPNGSGTSFFDPTDALLKSIYEAMERLCENSYKNDKIKVAMHNGLPGEFTNPSLFSRNPEVKSQRMGWVKGLNLQTNKKIYIPAQIGRLNYIRSKNEPVLDYPYNSSGSAGGSSPEHAILNGIYELIERDAFMTIYLNKISPPLLNINDIKDHEINEIVLRFKKFNLELYVIESTTDIDIPSYIALIIDRRGYPSVSVGTKSNLNSKIAIIGAISEALMCRLYVRNMLIKGFISNDLKSGKDIFSDRARHWVSPDSIENITFLTKGKVIKRGLRKFAGGYSAELSEVMKIINLNGFFAYSSDFTIDEFKKLGFYSYHTIISGIQPLYLNEMEREKSINEERLKKVASLFGYKLNMINNIPHPFL